MKRTVRMLIVAAVLMMALLIVVSAVGAASVSQGSDSTVARMPATREKGRPDNHGPFLPDRFIERPPETWPGPSPG